MRAVRLFLIILTLMILVRPVSGHAQVTGQAQVSVKEAFEAARELGTVDAWTAFLARFPDGFYADLARAYVKKLGDTAGSPAMPPPQAGAAKPVPASTTPQPDNSVPPTDPKKPAMQRGGRFMGFTERFNRYYTDPDWKPSQTIYVSPNGTGDGTRRDAPTSARAAVASARPGTLIHFLPGAYQGGIEFSAERSGSYDDPIVLVADRTASAGVKIDCAVGNRRTCINLEGASYIAIDGFELVGGNFGVRAVSQGLSASEHSRGVAVMNSQAHDQERDPFFSASADWAVWDRNLAYGAKKGDGHGIYLSNGGDWNIVRFNVTYGNASSDFQINPDPNLTCMEVGIKFDDPKCDGYAGEGEGGQGASDYFLVDGNHFHSSEVGPNFTSVRRSLIRNNIFGPQTRHNVSFWQESDNPKLGASGNKIVNNLFITMNRRHAVKFAENSTQNEFTNNVLLGVAITGGIVTGNPSALLMEVDVTSADNAFQNNFYGAGKIEGRRPSETDVVLPTFDARWFKKFPIDRKHDAVDLTPAADAPFVGKGAPSALAPTDRNGAARAGRIDAGPINTVASTRTSIESSPQAPIPAQIVIPTQVAGSAQGQAPAPIAAVSIARTTKIPPCTTYVDAAAEQAGDGSLTRPHKTIGAAVKIAKADAVICVTEGIYKEQVAAEEKYFTLAGGFARGSGFKVRDSAKHISKAQGDGSGSFLSIVDPGPKDGQLTAIDGFEITNYARAVVRDFYISQRFNLTNNHIHGNTCRDDSLAGAGFALVNVSGTISGNVIRNNACGRGGAGFVNDPLNQNTVVVERNLIEGNSGVEPAASHGGALYLFGNTLRITGNLFINNRVTQWGGGLYVGAYTQGNQPTTATLNWNVYRANRAGDAGGGFFCDDGATCLASHELYEGNCGGNVLVDGGSEGSGPTITKFDNITNVRALTPDCSGPGVGIFIDNSEGLAADSHAVTNSVFWLNGDGQDIASACGKGCDRLKFTVARSMVQTKSSDGSVKIVFGPGIVPPVDPLFVAPDKGDFRLRPESSASLELGTYGGQRK